ncbi:hypothetical protein [Hydrocoleum sp. CS-953]|uniref:hypothetical protein n=1 Tax=Hydrocoleum sp. CS-953 TaxID=1671698 RepID=UPI00117B88CF|nr:hypothetical protein [Hydrocoleum sp. CS-953]
MKTHTGENFHSNYRLTKPVYIFNFIRTYAEPTYLVGVIRVSISADPLEEAALRRTSPLQMVYNLIFCLIPVHIKNSQSSPKDHQLECWRELGGLTTTPK